MAQKQQKPVYDEQTMAFIQSAQMSIAKNHGLELDRDPAEIMRENNNALHEAAKAVKKRTGMVRQSLSKSAIQQPQMVPPSQELVASPKKTAPKPPVIQQPLPKKVVATDEEMSKTGYDAYMQSLMYSNEEEYEEDDDADSGIELSDLAEQDYEDEVEEAQPTPPPPPPPPPPQPKQKPRKKVGAHAPVVETVAPRMPAPKVIEQPKPASVFSARDITNYSEVRALPSGGRLYDSPIAGQALTLMDVLMMGSVDKYNITNVITELFNRKFTGGWVDGFNAENILECDEAYLLYWLRASSITDVPFPYVPANDNQPFQCPHCNKVAVTKEDYDKMPITFSDLDFQIKGDLNSILAKHAEKGYYAFTLSDGRECDVYLRRRFHDRIVMDYVDQYRNEMQTEMPPEYKAVMHTAAIVEIEDMDDIVKKTEYLGNMPYQMAKAFFNELESSTLTTVTTAKVRCPFCGKEAVIPYPFRLDLYLSGL